jgi:hypothetical protein
MTLAAKAADPDATPPRPADPLRPTDAQLVAMLWRFVREWRGPRALEPPVAAMYGYVRSAPLEKLKFDIICSPNGEAARAFLEEHWRDNGAERWRALVEERGENGLSGVLGLPGWQSCNLCMLCVRRPACAAVGEPSRCGIISQQTPAKHIKGTAHRIAAAEAAAAAAREQARAAQAAAAAAEARVTESAAREAVCAETAKRAGIQLVKTRLRNDERRAEFIEKFKRTATRYGVVLKGLDGLSQDTQDTKTWSSPTILSEEIKERAAAAKRPHVGGKGPAAALVCSASIPRALSVSTNMSCLCDRRARIRRRHIRTTLRRVSRWATTKAPTASTARTSASPAGQEISGSGTRSWRNSVRLRWRWHGIHFHRSRGQRRPCTPTCYRGGRQQDETHCGIHIHRIFSGQDETPGLVADLCVCVNTGSLLQHVSQVAHHLSATATSCLPVSLKNKFLLELHALLLFEFLALLLSTFTR